MEMAFKPFKRLRRGCMTNKLKAFSLFPAVFSFVIDNKLRRILENMDRKMIPMGVKPGMRVLEIGCGSGFVTEFLSNAVGDAGFVISIDVQENMIKKAKKKRAHLKNVEFLIQNVSDLNTIRDEAIDLAFCYYSFHEVSDKEKAVSELLRTLKHGGLLSIKEPRLRVKEKYVRSHEEFIAGKGFRFVESIKKCDFLGCYLKFIKD